MLYAHIDPNTQRKQLLEDHLFQTAEYAFLDAEIIGQSWIAFFIGLIHDLGKADRRFQHMICNHTNEKINHSSAGSRFVNALSKKIQETSSIDNRRVFSLLKHVVIYVVQAHHGLFDVIDLGLVEEGNRYITEAVNRMQLRMNYDKKDEKYYYNEDVLPFIEVLEKRLIEEHKLTFEDLYLKAYKEFEQMMSKLSWKDSVDRKFYEGCATRLYLSLLKRSDVHDTICAYEDLDLTFNPKTVDTWKNEYLQRVEQYYAQFENPTTKINQVRTHLANQIIVRGEEDETGIYRLSLPTGAGKTLLSLRYGMHQLVRKNKTRFFYITPFLSVLEQNAAQIKEVLGKDSPGLLEHHSNIVYREEEKEKDKDVDETYEESPEMMMLQYLTDTWDSPVVMSTMVQFMNTLFKGKSSNLRRFASLINSVVLLDEVQSLPIEVTHIFNLMMNFLKQVMNCTVVHCTATQPIYDSKYITYPIHYGDEMGEKEELVNMTETERKVFERVEVKLINEGKIADTGLLADYILKDESESLLVILNTTAVVQKVYEKIKDRSQRPCYYLSAKLCPEHRKDRIKNIKEHLKQGDPIVCVSTQLIEAGVDVDFEHVIRSYAGIDSIIQSAGRCNREGKKSQGLMELIRMNEREENLSKLQEIKNKKDITEFILDGMGNLSIQIEELNRPYYDRYYNTLQKLMDYPLKNDETLLNLLSKNKNMAGEYGKNVRLPQAFKKAAESFELINNETLGLIVHYKGSEELIEELVCF